MINISSVLIHNSPTPGLRHSSFEVRELVEAGRRETLRLEAFCE
jgi:hypothetical protein